MNKLRAFLILGIISILIPTVYAIDLPDDFDEPCPTGMSVLQAVCFAVNVNHDKADANIVAIDALESLQISEQTEQDGIQADIVALQTKIDVLDAELNILTLDLLTNTEGNIGILASVDGAIEPPTVERGFILYGDTLCEILGGTQVVIKFAGNTTVQHLTDCTSNPGDLIDLDTAQNELFQQGDILALERISADWKEAFRDQT